MKKLLAILLSVIMVLSLVACGNKTQARLPAMTISSRTPKPRPRPSRSA